jgi:hypothetical protein
MKKVILQIWEESTIDKCRQDGCSLHIDNISRDQFIEFVYRNRNLDNIPDSYERIVGLPIEAFVTDYLFNLVFKDKSIRLMTHEMNNLLMTEDIIYND